MCGRFTLANPKKIKTAGLRVNAEEIEKLKPRYNIAPSQNVAAIIQEDVLRLEEFRWGLIPVWAKDELIGQRLINARAETLTEKPSFRGALRKHRCLILADGFYEWAQSFRGKQPYLIRLRSQELFTFAGLWSHWRSSKGEELRSCTIITCAANELMVPIHDRMPVILGAEQRDIWLDTGNNGNPPVLTNVLRPYPADKMEAYPVSKMVNSPENDREECLSRYEDIQQ